MPHHELEPRDDDSTGTLGDKKSHLFSLFMGFGIGALVSAMVVLATAMTH